MIGIDLFGAIGLLKDWLTWEELPPLEVDRGWLELAKEKGVVPSDQEYRWSHPSKVASREMAGTHQVVWLGSELKRTRQKVVRRDGSVLIAKIEGAAQKGSAHGR